jgi:predicted GIY-YIG superfamily endonuclease
MIHSEEYPTITLAISRERPLKRWSAQKKQALLSGNGERLRSLAKRRRPKKAR